MLLAYETETSNKLVVRATGNDGLDGFKNAVSQVTVRTLAPKALITETSPHPSSSFAEPARPILGRLRLHPLCRRQRRAEQPRQVRVRVLDRAWHQGPPEGAPQRPHRGREAGGQGTAVTTAGHQGCINEGLGVPPSPAVPS